MILLSGLISASEVAFFSLTPSDLSKIKESKKTQDKITINHLNQPKFLLATILIANNIINISIVILATYIFKSNLVFSTFPFLNEILFQILLITFILLILEKFFQKFSQTITPFM